MLKASCDHGVCEINAQGNTTEVMADLMCIIIAVDDELESKDPAAHAVFRVLLKDDEVFERFGKAKQAKIKATEESRKMAETVIKLRKELDKND